MMAALKVFHAAMMPRRMQSTGWNTLMEDLTQAEDHYFYIGNEELTDVTWLEQPIKHMMKALVILVFRKKQLQGLPLISMAIGAGSNYQVTRRVTEFAQKYYQARYFMHKGVALDERY
jgi:hypothetical protein